jgi:hypothetical protein
MTADRATWKARRFAILAEAGYQLLPSEQEAFLNGWYQAMRRLEQLGQHVALGEIAAYLDRQVLFEYA